VQHIPLHAHPDLFRRRYRRVDEGVKFVGPAVDGATVGQHLRLELDTRPQEVVPGVWTTGAIVSRPEQEGGSRALLIKKDGEWIADPYRDDLSVVLQSASGLVLICGCCHAGLLNTLAHVRQVFGGDPIAVIGGAHLVEADDAALDRIIDILRGCGPPHLWLGHCTGEKATRRLKVAFGDKVSLCQAGTTLAF
jgi:7,8-dihydropterin-6-yl-methyl-4-(beta-D-ribofuranosyl)aminobenzene 5'-phosphate synthase